MQVTILEPTGYCAGVNNAINLALNTKKEYPNKNVVVLGMLVHNSTTLKMLEDNGIKTIFNKDSSLEELANSLTSPSVVILTAHGHSKNIENILKNNGHIVVDATCPFVSSSLKEIENKIKNNYEVFYIGVEGHPETIASLSISEQIKLINIKNPVIPATTNDNVFVISQTTLSEDEVFDLKNQIIKRYPSATISKGICNASTLRQNAIKNISNDVDGIIVVGGLNSNNTKTLFELAKTLYPNKVTLQVENASQIKEKDLLGLNHIVISSGASTPREIIEEIKNKLMN